MLILKTRKASISLPIMDDLKNQVVNVLFAVRGCLFLFFQLRILAYHVKLRSVFIILYNLLHGSLNGRVCFGQRSCGFLPLARSGTSCSASIFPYSNEA